MFGPRQADAPTPAATLAAQVVHPYDARRFFNDWGIMLTTIRGKAKYLGGVGTKVTGITRRKFKPNLQRVRVTVGGSNKTMNVCTQCLRSGRVQRRVRQKPFKVPVGAGPVS